MYPITFENEEQHIKHVLKNKLFYKKILGMALVDDLLTNESSVNKGDLYEILLEKLLQSKCSDHWTIIRNRKTRCMDIRLIMKENQELIIGIECKNKKTITKNDITKFKRDKIENKFTRSIFVSRCGIPKILAKEDSCCIIDDDLYIYTNTPIFLSGVITCFLSSITKDEKSTHTNLEKILHLYELWKESQKTHLELDKTFLSLLEDFGEDTPNGHLYLVTKSNTRGKFNYL
jgi:hypothetical protein